MRHRLVLPTIACFLTLSAQALAQKPSASCTSGRTPLTLQLGQGIPLPRSFSNPTNNRVTFIMTMRANSLFGPAHEVGRRSLAAKTGTTSSEATIHPTFLRTPAGGARVIIDVTTDRTGNEVVGTCDYQLSLKGPPGVPGKIPSRFPVATA